LIPHLNELYHTRRREVALITICTGSVTQCLDFKGTTSLATPLLVDEKHEIMPKYQVPGTPFAYLLDPNRRVLIRGVANDWGQFEALLDEKGIQEPGQMAWQVVRPASKNQEDDGAPALRGEEDSHGRSSQ
jgi:hypothetical protein